MHPLRSTKAAETSSAEGTADPEQGALLWDLHAEQGSAPLAPYPPGVPWGWCSTSCSSPEQACSSPAQPGKPGCPGHAWEEQKAHDVGGWEHVWVHMWEWEGRPGNPLRETQLDSTVRMHLQRNVFPLFSYASAFPLNHVQPSCCYWPQRCCPRG